MDGLLECDSVSIYVNLICIMEGKFNLNVCNMM